jgi:hypothetical protein
MGDPHFRKDNLDMMKIVCDETLQLIRERKPDLFICMGDILDTHERVHILPETAANNFLLSVADLVDTIILIGNHDRENNQVYLTDVHPFNGLKGHPRIKVIDKVWWDHDRNFIYVPYVSPGRLREAMMTDGWSVEGKQPRCGFCHQEFEGAKMGPVVSKDGDKWSSSLFPMFSGHVHDYQLLPGVVYVGTPYQTKFGDNPDKALMMVYIYYPEDTTSSEDLSTDQKKAPIRMERIPIVGIKKKKIIHMTKEDLMRFADILRENATYSLKVVLHLNESDEKAIMDTPQYIALKQSVDKLDIKTLVTNSSLAAIAMDKLHVQDRLNLDDVVIKMLESDEIAKQIYTQEIVIGR